MSDYDAWLEQPYTDASKDEAAFEEFCESQGIAFNSPHAWDLFNDWKDGCLEEDALERHEARMEREDEREERE